MYTRRAVFLVSLALWNLPADSLNAAAVTYVPRGASWRYFKGTEEPSPGDLVAWTDPSFSDEAWQVGAAPFGYGEPLPFGTVLSDMRTNYVTLYLRRTFTVPQPSKVGGLRAHIVYDDGFILWINGTELLRVNAPGSGGQAVAHDQLAPGGHEYNAGGEPYQVFDLPDPEAYLREGDNVLAVQMLNTSWTSSDLVFDCELIDPFGPDVFPPEVSRIHPFPGTTLRQLQEVTVVFNEPVLGVDAGDLLCGGVAALSVEGSGAGPYVFSVPALSPGVVPLAWGPDHGITDTADPPNAFEGGSWQYLIDPEAPPARVVITEIEASNASTLHDEDGQWPDWIELCNQGSEVVDLGGWSLTDNPELPGKWVFPAVGLGPGEYLVVFASGKDRREGGDLHTNFRLNAEGEYLGLYSPDSPRAVVAEFNPFPRQKRDISWGLTQEGTWAYFFDPTPGRPNVGDTAEGIVAPPAFSHRRGVCDESFLLELRCQTEGAEIYYRMDPEGRALTPQTGTLYTRPISIEGARGRGVVFVRAMATKAGYIPSDVVASTYIFPEDVLTQDNSPPGFPDQWGRPGNVIDADYELDPRVLNVPEYRESALRALREAPTLSVLCDIDDLFDAESGIYSNSDREGIAWERPASVEFIYPGGHTGCQIQCGIRIQGGSSTRRWKSPKLSLRLLFKDIYGPGALRFPLFLDSPVKEFETLVLDAHLNLTWIHPSSGQQIPAQYVRDAYCSDLQNAMGSLAPHDVFVNLYLNGVHWGMYDVHERADEDFAASYLGGEPDQYDLFKHDGGQLMAGTREAWGAMMQLARTADLSRWESVVALEEYLDIDDLCDYMIMNLFVGNDDWPRHNWYAARNRVLPGSQFRFFSWDAEHVLKSVTTNQANVNDGDSPAELYNRLRGGEDWRLLFADHVNRHFSEGGVLYVDPRSPQWDPEHPERNMPAALYMERIREVYDLIVLESARWGDYRRPSEPYTRDDEWQAELDRLLRDYFPQRAAIVLNQFRQAGLYPPIDAPVFSHRGGTVPRGFQLEIELPPGGAGALYYTTDGSDPRVWGSGEVNPEAQVYSEALSITGDMTVKCRIRQGTTWSALTEAAFHVEEPIDGLKVSEIMYHPPAGEDLPDDAYEFLELTNTGTAQIDLTGCSFTRGILFVFTEGTVVQPGDFVVICAHQEAFSSRYPGIPTAGAYTGRLDNDWDRLTLVDADGRVILSFSYADRGWWPAGADGEGFSLVRNWDAPEADLSRPSAWKLSSEVLGSPGREDGVPVERPPSIQRDLRDVTCYEGEQVTLQIVVSAYPPPSYRWERGGVVIEGADGPAYVTPPLGLEDSGTPFRCIVTNALGSVVSRTATVTVLPKVVPFKRGDSNADGGVDISDAIAILGILFSGEAPGACEDASDINDDGTLNIADPIALLAYLFAQGAFPPEPFRYCDFDQTPDGIFCRAFAPCEE